MAELNLVQKRKQKSVYSMLVLFGIFTTIFFLTSNKTEPITFGFILGDEFKLLSEWSVSSRIGSGIFMVLALFGVGLSYLGFKSDKSLSLGSFVFGLGSIMSFLCWAAAGKFIPFTGLLQAALLLSVPLIFGSMSGLLCEKSGVINPQSKFCVRLATIVEIKAANNNWPSMAIFITPDFSQSNPDIDPKINGTESKSAA